MTRAATVLVMASPWVLLIGGLAVVGGSLPWWALALYGAVAMASTAILVGVCRPAPVVESWDCPDFVEDDS